jgi:hypothetical protein
MMHSTYWYNYQVRWYHFIVPVIILAFFLYQILNGTGVINLTPDGVLQRLCTDLQTGQMQDAYNQFSSDYKHRAILRQTFYNYGRIGISQPVCIV